MAGVVVGVGLSVIVHNSNSPPYNLALDEVLLDSVSRGFREGVFRVWINSESIVIGAGLDVCEEVYCEEALRLRVPIYRRISGGGAVYHDLGNINASIVMRSEAPTVDQVYRFGLGFLASVLRRVGVVVHVENVNDLVVNGFKVSGSSAYIKPNAFLFHATLLVKSNISRLRRLIKPRLDRVRRGEVTPAKYNPGNLSWFIDVDTDYMVRVLVDYALGFFNNASRGGLMEWEVEKAIDLARNKYKDLLHGIA